VGDQGRLEEEEPESVSDHGLEREEEAEASFLPAVQQDSNTISASASLIPDKPNQPILSFPQRLFGTQKRSFCSTWYRKYQWLHYQESTDSVYCLVAELHGRPVSKYKDDKFCKFGFSNWKKAIAKFERHHNTKSHHEALDLVVKIPSTNKDVGNMLSSNLAAQKIENKKILRIILSNIRFLGRQGLALRGQYRSGDDQEKGCETDSNFIQLLKLRAEDNPNVLNWIGKAQDKFTSPDTQN
jgi:hypothetical protein